MLKIHQDHAWIDIKTANGDSILCGCVYRSPSNDATTEGCTQSTMAVINLIKTAYDRNINLIVAGDFNYKNIDWWNEYAEQEYLVDFINTLQDCFLYQHVTEPTRHRDNEPSNFLDLILSSEEGTVKDLSYHPPLGESDHVVLKFDVSLGQVKQETPPSRNIYKANYDLIKSNQNDRKWDELLTSSFEDDYKTFFDILRNLLDKYTPFKAKQVRKKSIYMTSKAMRLKNKKRRLWKRYIPSKSNSDRQNYIRCKK